MTETQERFLKAVAGSVPLNRVAEVYLFPAIRQGGVETGIAVVAAEREVPLDAGPPGRADVPSEVPADVPAASVALAAAPDPEEGSPANTGRAVRDASSDAPIGAAAAPSAPLAAHSTAPTGAPPQQHDRPDAAGERHHHDAVSTIGAPAADGEHGGPRDRGGPGDHDQVPVRHTIFSARYRLALKGPDRGKWEVDVVAEADAPLVTVDAIVRGIRKRTGEAADAERVSPDVLRGLAAQHA